MKDLRMEVRKPLEGLIFNHRIDNHDRQLCKNLDCYK